MDRSWTVGSGAGCDVVAAGQTVSGRHCRIEKEGDAYFVEDLRSTNGTYVNGKRIEGRVRVARGDSVTLGAAIPMPWPEEEGAKAGRVIRIGREADNDVVIPLPMVSGYHARVVWDGGPGAPILEDLNSANGTAIGGPDRKVQRSALRAGDTVFLGSHAIPAAEILHRLDPGLVPCLAIEGNLLVLGRDPGCERVIDRPGVADRHASLVRVAGVLRIEDLKSGAGTTVNGRKIEGETPVRSGDLIGLGGFAFVLDDRGGAVETRKAPAEPAPIIAAPIASPIAEETRRTPSPGPAWPAALLPAQAAAIGLAIAAAGKSGSGVAAGLSWMALAAIWSGLAASVVVGSGGLGRRLGGVAGIGDGWGISLGLSAGLALAQCLILWLFASIGLGLSGPALPMIGLMAVASGVGLGLGSVADALAPRPSIAWASIASLMLALWALDGERWPSPGIAAPARMAGEALPSRWAFEGLLLLESDRRGGAEGLAEPYFPAESARMGPFADALALAFMAIGWSGLARFVTSGRRPGPGAA